MKVTKTVGPAIVQDPYPIFVAHDSHPTTTTQRRPETLGLLLNPVRKFLGDHLELICTRMVVREIVVL